MILLALLLLASIQTGPVMASLEELVEKFPEAGKKALDFVVKKAPEQALTKYGESNPAWKPFTDGAKKGLKVHRYLCKAQRLMDKQNPAGGASGNFVVNILGSDLLPKSFPTFSFSFSYPGTGTSNSVVPCSWYKSVFSQQVPPTTSFRRITGIRVGGQPEIRVEPPAYPSAAPAQQRVYYYGSLLREAVHQTMKEARPITTDDPLCYRYAVPLPQQWSSLPRIAILLGMPTTELSVDATRTVWYQDSSMYCLRIGRTVELILG